MNQKLDLERVASGLWTVKVPFRMFGLALQGRTHVIQLPDGGVVVHTPSRLPDATWDEITRLGPVRALLAPNKMHHLAFGDAAARFPEARKLAAPGLADKRRDLSFDGVLGDQADPVFAGTLVPLHVPGMPMLEEVAFLHPATRTLLLVDLLFHFPTAAGLTRLYLKMSGALGKPAQTAILRRAVKERARTRAALDRLLDLDFDRVLLAHDTTVETGGKEALRDASAWLTV